MLCAVALWTTFCVSMLQAIGDTWCLDGMKRKAAVARDIQTSIENLNKQLPRLDAAQQPLGSATGEALGIRLADAIDAVLESRQLAHAFGNQDRVEAGVRWPHLQRQIDFVRDAMPRILANIAVATDRLAQEGQLQPSRRRAGTQVDLSGLPAGKGLMSAEEWLRSAVPYITEGADTLFEDVTRRIELPYYDTERQQWMTNVQELVDRDLTPEVKGALAAIAPGQFAAGVVRLFDRFGLRADALLTALAEARPRS